MHYFIIDIIRFSIGFILLALAMRAFLKTRLPAMLYLTIGFALLTVGHLLADIYFFNSVDMARLFSEVFDILGLMALIIAIKKS
ncbi:hypothetical protein ANME2D_02844 [Candidatus Methanoperedens nitroreducens]|uniref:Uncharacterized protein n=1 Tax=Candidatus Methanoperedens nitratireducens TaxID=1392998 RepID=A0A062V4T1_9EURY|nr:hypothetical protein [Candidatus Methanoperedens nitroreducens]KCZ70819.1 hypothetical protein ANME2D_02844 [Candidatus Methanoperedens nitroreducens]MDJ1420673.1 hypothetical protein [Candidatus Methanoperedens sp.]